MQIYPVIDLMDGLVVRGVAGQRDQYRPIESCLVDGADVLAVARRFRERLGLQSLYVADLDAILRQRPNLSLYGQLVEEGFDLMIDAGLRHVDSAQSLLDTGASAAVAGLETIAGPEQLQQLCEHCGQDRIVFSLDMLGGAPLGTLSAWNQPDPFAIAVEALQAGIRRMIVLDLAQVGVGTGLSTRALCQRLRHECPALEIITGGGIRGLSDLLALQAEQIDGALVASALHDGSIGTTQLRQFADSL